MAREREAAADYRLQTSRLTGTVLTKCMTALISWQCPFFSIINSLLLDRSRTSAEIDENHDVSARSSSLKMESHACVLLHRLWCASPGEILLARVAWRRNAARRRGAGRQAREPRSARGSEGSPAATLLSRSRTARQDRGICEGRPTPRLRRVLDHQAGAAAGTEDTAQTRARRP